ncbi:unnamed protein product [Cladocopium goreaui]|uniref:Uncharacterized protein n=1 Tax=Cladocopium goreaui TaxID=2562237 RepID=A0A9P1FL81_9DINO|nr:unnamed protein product [Cladocopium goreaui]
MIHRRQHGAGSGEGAADESAAGADATAVAEHALVLVPGDRSQCIASIACTKSAQPAEESLDRQDTYGGDHVNTSVDDLLGGSTRAGQNLYYFPATHVLVQHDHQDRNPPQANGASPRFAVEPLLHGFW